jgi:HK97 family phage major capsid protein
MKMDPAKREKAIALGDELGQLFRRYPVAADMPVTVQREIEGKMAELTSLTEGRHLDDLRAEHSQVDRYLNEPVGRPPQPGGDGGGSAARYSGKSVGELFVESKAFRNYDPARRSGPSAEISLKALLSSTEWVPEAPRIGRIEPAVSPPLRVLDLFATGNTSYNTVPYMEETTSNGGAAEVAEGEEKPESELGFTEKSSPVQTVATLLPITNQLLEDVGAARSYVDMRLAYFVRARLDSQLLNGDGSAPNLRGILHVVGLQTQAKGSDPTPDAMGKAMDLVRVNGGYEPTAVIMHPSDWQDIRHLRTADGQYIWGNPADASPARIWGLPVAVTTAIAEHTALVGAFSTAAMIFYRSNLAIALSDSHSDFFIKNKVMLRAELRVALACFRPAAFCQVTGL